MKKTPLYALVAVLLVLLGWTLFLWEPAAPRDDRHQPLELAARPQGGDFTLESREGPLALRDLRGKVVLLYFGYTYCPDVCPTNLGFIAMALERLTPQQLERVQVLFVSVDPERDTPERLAEYGAYFHPKVLGLTGTPEQLAHIAALYGAAYRKVEQPESATGYLVDHSSYTYLIDPAGNLHGILDHATAPKRIAAAVRELLQPVSD